MKGLTSLQPQCALPANIRSIIDPSDTYELSCTDNTQYSLVDFKASLLRCQYAEACRQRDLHAQPKRLLDSAVLAFRIRQILRSVACVRDTFVGSIQTIRSLPHVLTLCDRPNVISFDLFDTLLYRTVEPPDVLKRLAAEFAAQIYSARGFPITPELFLYLRNESEARQRRVAQKNGSDAECKLSGVIYETLCRLFDVIVAEDDMAKLIDHEVCLECQHLRVADGVPKLLQTLKSRGKRIVVTTDTYLELRHIQEILAHLGLGRWIDAIYASSEHGLGKYSGGLFRKILESESIQPISIIHVGDTYESDVRGAIKAGIGPVFLFDVRRLRLRSRHRLSSGRGRPIAKGSGLSSGAPRRAIGLSASGKNRDSELYRIGRDILGPAFTLFIVEVLQESYRVGATDIYYLAREGWLFRELHKILTDRVHRLKHVAQLRYHYLFVSRLATSLPGIRGFSDREWHLVFYRDRAATVAECIRAFGLDPSEFSDLSIDFDDRHPSEKARLFGHPEFIARVHARADVARSKLYDYLTQEGFFNPNETKVLVDIGWNATIQANLTYAFHDKREFPLVVGYYFGRKYDHDDYLASPRSLYMPGRFFDQKRRNGREHAIGHCLEMFELAATAPHGTTMGYEVVSGRVQPVVKENEEVLSEDQRVLQTGILDHALLFAESWNSREVDLALLHNESVERLSQLILRPTLGQTRALRNMKHSVDWGSKESRPLIAANANPMLALKPRQLCAALQESYWLEGCMRITRIPGGLALLSLVRRILRYRGVSIRFHRAMEMFFRNGGFTSAE